MRRLAVLAVVLSACYASPNSPADTFSKPNVATRLNCPENQIVVRSFGDEYTRIAEGCGRREMYTFIDVTDGVGWIPMQDLTTRAGFDFSCPREQIGLVALSTGRQVGASGCGKKAVYTFTAVSPDQYEWVMDGGRH